MGCKNWSVWGFKKSYSSFLLKHHDHSPGQPMLEDLTEEKSTHRHILPSMGWMHFWIDWTTKNPWIWYASRYHCCFPQLPSLLHKIAKQNMNGTQKKWDSFLYHLLLHSLYCIIFQKKTHLRHCSSITILTNP